jgi:uncharacterized Zn finger protein (UPF0148 family)
VQFSKVRQRARVHACERTHRCAASVERIFLGRAAGTGPSACRMARDSHCLRDWPFRLPSMPTIRITCPTCGTTATRPGNGSERLLCPDCSSQVFVSVLRHPANEKTPTAQSGTSKNSINRALPKKPLYAEVKSSETDSTYTSTTRNSRFHRGKILGLIFGLIVAGLSAGALIALLKNRSSSESVRRAESPEIVRSGTDPDQKAVNLADDGRRFWRFAAVHGDGWFEMQDDGTWIEKNQGRAHVQSYLSQANQPPKQFRISAKLDKVYDFEFQGLDDQYLSVKLTDAFPHSEVNGYVSRRSADGERLAKLLADGKEHEILVEFQLSSPNGAPLEVMPARVGIITKLVSESWLD